MLPKLWFGFNLSKNYAVDIGVLYFYRSLEDGISILDLTVDYSTYESDHNPSFEIRLAICNFVLLDLTIYNRSHV
jgi:hypothetical protein